MATQPVRVDDETHTWLSSEATRRGTSIADLIAEGVKLLQEAQFWTSLRDEVTAWKADKRAWRQELEDRKILDELVSELSEKRPRAAR